MPPLTLGAGGRGQERSLYHVAVCAIFLWPGKKRACLAQGKEEGLIKGSKEGTMPKLCGDIAGHISEMLQGRRMVVERG